MIKTVVSCDANMMSIEACYNPHSIPECTGTRSNVNSRKIQNGLKVAYGTYQQYIPPRKRSPVATSQGTIMPVSTSSQSLLASLPSFMSVFRDGPDRSEAKEANTNTGLSHSPGRTHFKRPQNFTSSFVRRDSASTFESTESSPTTTISTVESSVTEPSPQTPPESPDSALPLPSFKYLRTQSVSGVGIMGEQERREHFSTSFTIMPGVERSDSPNKKMRNMKNLSVNTAASNRHSPQLPKLGLCNQSGASHAFSAPPTPAFIVPPKMSRKKPSTLGLTITTPETCSAGQACHDGPNAVPQTPSDSHIRTLRKLQTSSNGSLFSPTVAPEGGMRLPPFSNQTSSGRYQTTRPPLSVSPRNSFDVASSPITRQTLDHVQEESDYDLPLSQEVKSPAYPQGPVCIYDPFVYLYLEPSHVEAREFDVILNVAREVKNPFTVVAEQIVTDDSKKTEVAPCSEMRDVYPSDHVDTVNHQISMGEGPSDTIFTTQVDNTASTPQATPKAPKSEPEYVHVPWDHNTNVVDDLLKLCELIDDRARQEKRVLVHCQCGVSRSASLVVAYGIYKNPQLTVQEAYDAVKNRSRWIGPNMNLIYQLSEFKSRLPKTHSFGTSAWHLWRNNLTIDRSAQAKILISEPRAGLTSSALRSSPQISLSRSSQLDREPSIPRPNSFSPPGSAQLLPIADPAEISPGPSSAPPNMQFPPDKAPASSAEASKPSDGPTGTFFPFPPRTIEGCSVKNPAASFMGEEAIESKSLAPAGAVANDLQEVAKDLDVSEHTPTLPSPSKDIDMDSGAGRSLFSTDPAPPDVDMDDSISPTTTSFPSTDKELVSDSSLPLPAPSPILPAGFNSLLNRRQGPPALKHLPLRQDLPRLVSIQNPQRTFDPDVPPTPSLLSPRAAEFTASPFHRTAAGDLAGSSVFERGLLSPKTQAEDPRSPAQRGEAPITRSIFDMI